MNNKIIEQKVIESKLNKYLNQINDLKAINKKQNTELDHNKLILIEINDENKRL